MDGWVVVWCVLIGLASSLTAAATLWLAYHLFNHRFYVLIGSPLLLPPILRFDWICISSTIGISFGLPHSVFRRRYYVYGTLCTKDEHVTHSAFLTQGSPVPAAPAPLPPPPAGCSVALPLTSIHFPSSISRVVAVTRGHKQARREELVTGSAA